MIVFSRRWDARVPFFGKRNWNVMLPNQSVATSTKNGMKKSSETYPFQERKGYMPRESTPINYAQQPLGPHP